MQAGKGEKGRGRERDWNHGRGTTEEGREGGRGGHGGEGQTHECALGHRPGTLIGAACRRLYQ